ncbi:MAG: protein kinase [Polyangiaceae bacterium]
MQSGLEAAAGVREGDLLAGKYRVDRLLGVGAMGAVVAAHHVHLDTKVAIKFILPAMLANQEAVRRFAREARAAVKITSEHVARVLDVGTLENGAPYMVMEFLDGLDLAHWLERQGPLPIEQAVDFILQATVAVAEAHGLGIVHRDLKPSNLFCVRRADGQLSVKVLDFGISKVTGSGFASLDMSATKTTSIVGSPLYMSPEQMQGSKSVDARADIWAFGVILYELITGKTPFDGTTLPEVCTKISLGWPEPIRSLRPSVPVGLETVILKCLAKTPAGRYQNVAELALALLEFGSRRAKASVERISGIIQSAGLSASALALPPSPQPTSERLAAASIAPLGGSAPGPHGRRKIVAGTMGVASGLALVGAVGAYSLGVFRSKPRPSPLDEAQPTAAVARPASVAIAAIGVDASSLWIPTTPPSAALAPIEPPTATATPSATRPAIVHAIVPPPLIAPLRPPIPPAAPPVATNPPAPPAPVVSTPPAPTPQPRPPARNPLDLPLQ